MSTGDFPTARDPYTRRSDNNDADVVKLLLERGANITVVNGDGKTPLKMAEEKAIRRLLGCFAMLKKKSTPASSVQGLRFCKIHWFLRGRRRPECRSKVLAN